MDRTTLDGLRRLEAEVSPGAWEANEHQTMVIAPKPKRALFLMKNTHRKDTAATVALIAAMRNALPELL